MVQMKVDVKISLSNRSKALTEEKKNKPKYFFTF